jgi:hypothetical protein
MIAKTKPPTAPPIARVYAIAGFSDTWLQVTAAVAATSRSRKTDRKTVPLSVIGRELADTSVKVDSRKTGLPDLIKF